MRPGEHKIEIKLDPRPLKKFLNYELKWDLVSGLKETIPYYLDQFNILYLTMILLDRFHSHSSFFTMFFL